MSKVYKLVSMVLLFGLVFSLGVFASSEASDEPSGEPTREISFVLTIAPEETDPLLINMKANVSGNVYTFDLNSLLETLGVTMSYDPDSRTVRLDHMPTLPKTDNSAS